MEADRVAQTNMLDIMYNVVDKIIIIDNKRTKRRFIHADNEMLNRITENTATGDLILYFGKSTARVFLAKTTELIYVRGSHNYNICLLSEKYLYAGDVSNPRAWIRLRKDYSPLDYTYPKSGFGFNASSTFTRTLEGKASTFFHMDQKITINQSLQHEIYNHTTSTSQKEAERVTTKSVDKMDVPRTYGSGDKDAHYSIPLNILQHTAQKHQWKLCFSPSRRWLIRYSTRESAFFIYKTDNEIVKLICGADKHACCIKHIDYIKQEEYFGSLDSGGKFKIWHFKDEELHVCQTVAPEEFHDHRYYDTFVYDPILQSLRFSIGGLIDIYKLNLDAYHPKQPNHLISYQETQLIPAPVVKTKSKYTSPNESNSKPLSKAATPVKKVDYTPEGLRVESPSLSERTKPLIIEQTYDPHRMPRKKKVIPYNTPHPPNDSDKQRKPILHESPPYIYSTVTMERETPNDKNASDSGKSQFVKKTTEINVGVDFGTSRTKVSYYNYANNSYTSIDFSPLRTPGSAPEYESWSLPSIAAIDGENIIYGFNALLQSSGEKFDHLKQTAFNSSSPLSKILCCCGYLAYVFNQAQTMIKNQLFLESNVRFSFSVCLPVMYMNDNKTAINFRRLLSFTESVFLNSIWGDYRKMEESYKDFNHVFPIAKLNFTEIIPESLAEILDLIQLTTVPGLYALYDFGAGTTELTVFSVNAGQKKGYILDTHIVNKGFADIENEVKDNPDAAPIVSSYYQEIWKNFDRSNIWGRIKNSVHGDGSMARIENIRLFTSGGASNREEIKNIFKAVPLYKAKDEYYSFPLRQITEPYDWDNTRPPYHRYAVSYGLTHEPRGVIESFKLPRDCPDFDTGWKMPKMDNEDKIHNNNINWLRK